MPEVTLDLEGYRQGSLDEVLKLEYVGQQFSGLAVRSPKKAAQNKKIMDRVSRIIPVKEVRA